MARRVTVPLVVFLIAIFAQAPLLRASTPDPPAERPPALLLLHSGGFVIPDGTHMARARRIALAAGFEPHYVDYPSGLRAAVGAAQRAAQDLRAHGRSVYAYGESVGGTLAGLLAERHLVDAAATYAPVANLRRFVYNATDDPELYMQVIGADRRLLLHDSPGLHDSDRPIFVMRAVGDDWFMNDAERKWDARDPEVKSIAVRGEHLGGDDRRLYAANVRLAIEWLARRSGL